MSYSQRCPQCQQRVMLSAQGFFFFFFACVCMCVLFKILFPLLFSRFYLSFCLKNKVARFFSFFFCVGLNGDQLSCVLVF